MAIEGEYGFIYFFNEDSSNIGYQGNNPELSILFSNETFLNS